MPNDNPCPKCGGAMTRERGILSECVFCPACVPLRETTAATTAGCDCEKCLQIRHSVLSALRARAERAEAERAAWREWYASAPPYNQNTADGDREHMWRAYAPHDSSGSALLERLRKAEAAASSLNGERFALRAEVERLRAANQRAGDVLEAAGLVRRLLPDAVDGVCQPIDQSELGTIRQGPNGAEVFTGEWKLRPEYSSPVPRFCPQHGGKLPCAECGSTITGTAIVPDPNQPAVWCKAGWSVLAAPKRELSDLAEGDTGWTTPWAFCRGYPLWTTRGGTGNMLVTKRSGKIVCVEHGHQIGGPGEHDNQSCPVCCKRENWDGVVVIPLPAAHRPRCRPWLWNAPVITAGLAGASISLFWPIVPAMLAEWWEQIRRMMP